ncbi:MAG TPA: PAS domain-containing protein [Ramlibacter sp.]|uniref:PAS domain-containing protein n=1 Tax=Ramlibacter sp. TaxID=1917967 RepID=UPI002ED45767
MPPNRSPAPEAPQLTLSERPADASSRRAAMLVVALSAGIFLALAPLADVPLAQAAWFIPLIQSALIINDLTTAALLFGQLRFNRQSAVVVLAGGYVFAAVMAGIHMLTFPGVFSAGGLLGAGTQTTGYLYVFWHLGTPLAVLAYTALRQRKRKLKRPAPVAIAEALAVAVLLAGGLALLATRGNDLLPPMLDGIRYSSAFNSGRYGQWVVTGLAMVVLWRRRTHSVLDVWLLVMLCDSFFEIALVSIFNAGRYDVGFYAGRVYAVVASSIVLVMLLTEYGKMYRELAGAQETARSEASLRESREVLSLAMHGGRMAAWTRDLEHGTTWWTPEVEELTGWPAVALGASDRFFFDRVHPADRENVRAMMDAEAAPQEEFAVEFRLRHADGRWRWLEARGQALLDEDGALTRLFGVAVDITVHKQSAQATAELEARFRALADGMPQLAWMARPDGWIYWYNRRWYEYTGTTFEQMEGWGWRSVQDPVVLPAVVAQIRRSFETGEDFEMVFPLRGADGEFRPFLTRMLPLKDAEGHVLAWFGTNTDITQQRAEEEALRIADRRKDEFIATLAHELRNPLAPIRTAVELIGRAGPLPPTVVRMREILDRQSRHLTRLVDDLLEVSRITQGKLLLQRSRVSLSECVHDAVHAARPALEAAGHQLVEHTDPEPLYANADATRITQAVVNLLNNASKFTPPGGRIVVSSWREDGKACICVADNGIGIAPEHLHSIFGMFSQVSSARERSHGGLGIGLALVRGFVELHGGTVEARSAGTGQGSEFLIRVPLLQSDAPLAETGRQPARPAMLRRVLVVDDNVDAATSLAALLSHEGHEVRVAHGGEEALMLAFEFEPEAVLLDIGMPGMNGLEVARELRRRMGTGVRLIAVTGWGQAQDRELTREAGFDFHLTKPVGQVEVEPLLATRIRAGVGVAERGAVQRH